MNAERLLVHYERIADAPDAANRLRRFILHLAVRGKLVPQDPSDEPASELLKRIATEKARLVKAGEIKPPKPLSMETSESLQQELPNNWKWVPFGETINRHLGGGTPSKNNATYWDGDVLWASVKDIGTSKYLDDTVDRITEAGLADSPSNLIPPGNLIVVTRMGLGKVSINRVPIAINQDLRALSLSSLMDIDYCYVFLKTHGFEGTGLTVKGIKIEELLCIPFPPTPRRTTTHRRQS
jgi:type I restriction enzyme, S subunit